MVLLRMFGCIMLQFLVKAMLGGSLATPEGATRGIPGLRDGVVLLLCSNVQLGLLCILFYFI